MTKWNPDMSQAPRDGTWILVVVEGFVPDVAFWEDGGWKANEDEEAYSSNDWPVTHWQPLPKAPK